MSLNVNEGQSGNAVAVFTDASGVVRPLAPGNVPVWAIDPPASATLTPAADGMSCAFTAGTTDGAATLTCTAEGDPVVGVDTIVASFVLTVVAPEDTQGTISVTLN